MKFFTTYKPHYKATLTLGIPIIIGQLGQIVLGWADNIMVGHYSTESLAAASFVNNLFNLPVLFGLGFSYGLTPIVASLLGQREYYKIGNFLKNSLLTNIIIACLLIGLMSILVLNVQRLGQPKELIPLIVPYFWIQLVSLLFVMAFNSFKQFSDGIMETRTPMFIMLGANVIHIISNYLLIYGHFGLPELGLMGAGISTLFARVLMLAAMAFVFYRHKIYRRYKIGFNKSFLNKPSLKKLSGMGIFIGLQMGMENGAFSISTIMMGWVGTIALASHQIVCTITTIGFMVYYGIGAAIAVRVSNFMAKKDWTNVKHTASSGFHIILAFVIFVSTILFFTRGVLGHLFVEEKDVINLVTLLMVPVILFQFGDGLQICYANILRGLHDVKAMALISFIGYVLIALPCSYILGFVFDFGAVGIWFGFPIGLTITGILFFLRYKQQIKKKSIV